MSKIIYVSLIAFTTFILGCDSKSVESSPDSVKSKGLSLDTRLAEKSKVDLKLDDIQRAAEKAQRIIEMFKRVQSPSGKEDVYTPIDLLLDINSELKAQIPENHEGKLVRRGKLVLPIDALSPQCRTINTILETSDISETDGGGEKMTYFLSSCGSNGRYLPAIEATWIKSTLEFKLMNKNFETLFNDIIFADALRNSLCKVRQGSKKIIDSIYCENFKVKLSKSEYANVNNMAFNNSGDVRFETQADIFEHNFKKAKSQIYVFSNGEVKFEVKNIGEN